MGGTFTCKFGIAGSVYAGGAAESGDFQSCVIGKTVEAVVLLHVTGFLKGVALQRLCRLGDILMATDVGESQDYEAFAQDLSHFLEFVGVVGGKNQFHCVV